MRKMEVLQSILSIKDTFSFTLLESLWVVSVSLLNSRCGSDLFEFREELVCSPTCNFIALRQQTRGFWNSVGCGSECRCLIAKRSFVVCETKTLSVIEKASGRALNQYLSRKLPVAGWKIVPAIGHDKKKSDSAEESLRSPSYKMPNMCKLTRELIR